MDNLASFAIVRSEGQNSRSLGHTKLKHKMACISRIEGHYKFRIHASILCGTICGDAVFKSEFKVTRLNKSQIQQEYILWNAVSVSLPHVAHHELLRKQDCHASRYRTDFYKRTHLHNCDDVIMLCYIMLSNAVTSCA